MLHDFRRKRFRLLRLTFYRSVVFVCLFVCLSRSCIVHKRQKIAHDMHMHRDSPISLSNCGRMVTDSATVTMESIQETTIALSNGAIADPLRHPLPPK